MNFKAIGNHIDEIRTARGWSKSELSRRVGTSATNVALHIKTGKMTIEMLLRYAEALGCSVEDLTAGATDIKKFKLDADFTALYPFNLAIAVALGNSNYYHNMSEYRLHKKMDEIKDELYKIYIPGVYKSLETLTEREQKVLDLRFRHGMIYEDVGKEFGVTRERIRQVEVKALRKLRHPRHYKHWKMDTVGEAWEAAKERDRYRLENITLKDKLKAALEKTGLTEDEIDGQVAGQELIPEVTVDDMELSVRSYNCLKRAGINTLTDLQKMTFGQMMKVRNLGRKSLNEIIAKMAEYGAKLKEEENGETRTQEERATGR